MVQAHPDLVTYEEAGHLQINIKPKHHQQGVRASVLSKTDAIQRIILLPLQSAYRKLHSIETTLLKIINDMFEEVDLGHTIILIVPDLSIVFDTIDHSILLNRLKSTFKVTGSALSWVRSYLTELTSFV